MLTQESSAPCTIHSFESIQIHAGAHLMVSLPRDTRTMHVNAEACTECGEIKLRIQFPTLLRERLGIMDGRRQKEER